MKKTGRTYFDEKNMSTKNYVQVLDFRKIRAKVQKSLNQVNIDIDKLKNLDTRGDIKY